MCRGYKVSNDSFKKKLADQQIYKKDCVTKSSETSEFVGFARAIGLFRFYFNMTSEDINNLNEEDFATTYAQLQYALEFDAYRTNGDGKKKIYMPI